MKMTSVNGASCVQLLASVSSPLSPASEGSLLPDPTDSALGGGSIEQLAVILTQADEQDRTQSRALEQTADNAATREENQQVDAMRQKADSDRDAAMWTGVGEIVGGALTAGSACVTASANAADGTARSDGVPPRGNVDWHAALEAAAKASPGVGTIASGACSASGQEDDASASKSGAAAQADLRRCNEARDDAQAANDSIQKLEQFLDHVLETQNATRLAAAGLRA
jgi:hypothetical protein